LALSPFKWINIASFGCIFYCLFVACLRTEMRTLHGIYGSTMEDFCTTLTMLGFASQLEYRTKCPKVREEAEAATEGASM
jgi:hypothetical protein